MPSSVEKLARASSLGADETVDYRANPDWDKAVMDKTAGRGVDDVVEVGGSGTFNRSTASARIGGTMSLIGVLTGVNDVIATGPISQKSLRINGVYVGSPDVFDPMNLAVAVHGLRPVVDRTFPFEEARDAYKHLESAKHFGKLVLEVTP